MAIASPKPDVRFLYRKCPKCHRMSVCLSGDNEWTEFFDPDHKEGPLADLRENYKVVPDEERSSEYCKQCKQPDCAQEERQEKNDDKSNDC